MTLPGKHRKGRHARPHQILRIPAIIIAVLIMLALSAAVFTATRPGGRALPDAMTLPTANAPPATRPPVTRTPAEISRPSIRRASPTISPFRPAPTAPVASPAAALATVVAYAEAQRGKPYCYGGEGPGCYDCSGLVMQAYAAIGVDLPRTTYDIQPDPRLHRIDKSQARRGDLVFEADDHVEFYWTADESYGAHHTGTVIGPRPYYGTYLRFYRVTGT